MSAAHTGVLPRRQHSKAAYGILATMAAIYEQLIEATENTETPFALLNEDAFWSNADDIIRRANGVRVRLASKSIRIRELLHRTLSRPGFIGVMAYSLEEANWLADHGIDDVLVAYPNLNQTELQALISGEKRRESITLMVDSLEHLDYIDATLGSHPDIRVCLDVDASLRIGPIHLGVRRSPIRTARQAEKLARSISRRRGYQLVGVMFYDAQIAGVPDSSIAVKAMKRRSHLELSRRRASVVQAVSRHAQLEIINAGGTGSLDITGTDPVITELSAGSGLFQPTLFDGYENFRGQPAAFYVLSVVRKPTNDIATLYAGGYIASGSPTKSRQPSPSWPAGLQLLNAEGAGEVQTPVTGRSARSLRIGDRVLMRHAKAGEMCERFDSVAVVSPARGAISSVLTYRGEGMNFG